MMNGLSWQGIKLFYSSIYGAGMPSHRWVGYPKVKRGSSDRCPKTDGCKKYFLSAPITWVEMLLLKINVMENKRENGFYWVKVFEETKWDIAEWWNSVWLLGGETYLIDEFEVVNPDRLLNPDEQQSKVNQNTNE